MNENIPSNESEKPSENLLEQARVTDTMPAAEAPVAIKAGPTKRKFHKEWWAVPIVLVLALAGFLGWHYAEKSTSKKATQTIAWPSKPFTPVYSSALELDTSKNYGNKYANGILPVGDGKYSTSGAKSGYVYACSQYAQNLMSGQGGAQTRGPWFVNNNTEYDINKKLHVQGNVMWQASFTNTLSGGTRSIVTNDLPTHPTGVFPIASSDPAYAYDHNPNSIKGQTLAYNLPAAPTYSSTPNCMGGEAGVMLTGVALFNAFDAGGRDAGAWEVQDSCQGHPQSDGLYHYHTLSSCIKNISVHTVIGFALDGFPITGPTVGNDNVLTTSDLDECHGITSQIVLDGKTVTSYHYVMTQDFPYSVSCFRGQAIQPPDLQSQAGTTGQKQSQTSPTEPIYPPPPHQPGP